MRTIAAYSKAEDAHLLRARLEGSGIAAYVRDEHMVSIDWMYSNAVGGVRVDVADEDVERVRELLAAEAGANGSPPAAPRKARHGAARYVTVFSGLVVFTFGILVGQVGVPSPASMAATLGAAVLVAAVLTAVAAVFNL